MTRRRRARWQDTGRTIFSFYAHDGDFPWPKEGTTTTDPRQALVWARFARIYIRRHDDRYGGPYGRILSGHHRIPVHAK